MFRCCIKRDSLASVRLRPACARTSPERYDKCCLGLLSLQLLLHRWLLILFKNPNDFGMLPLPRDLKRCFARMVMCGDIRPTGAKDFHDVRKPLLGCLVYCVAMKRQRPPSAWQFREQ